MNEDTDLKSYIVNDAITNLYTLINIHCFLTHAVNQCIYDVYS